MTGKFPRREQKAAYGRFCMAFGKNTASFFVLAVHSPIYSYVALGSY